ncbi:RluA family pseudouridine synthase [Psychrobacter sp. HD31]|uniref:RluA family pseudouridine synthase n=1 Tax=Psychrobacter sp. HD31 TaxID=3112003 RepID=UPI003DA62E9D
MRNSHKKGANSTLQSTAPRLGSKQNPFNADNQIDNFAQVNHIKVTQNQQGQRLDNFLLARLKGLPKSHLYKLIRADEVRVNNKRCKPHDKLFEGDIIRLAPVKIASRKKPVVSQAFANSLLDRIIYEDEGLLVLNKPSGMAVHGGSGENFGVIEAMRAATGKNYLELVHRIDKDTSGLLMISKKRSTLKKLQQHLRDKTIQKYYFCLVKGHVVMDTQLIDAPLLRYNLPSGERRVKVDGTKDQSKLSQTDITVQKRFVFNKQKVSLVQAMPKTGRTHQIRVHMGHIGHPLLGDDKYNRQDTSGVRRLCLHAYKLQIPDYPTIIAPMPADMDELILNGA